MSHNTDTGSAAATEGRSETAHRAGAFDIRTFIAALIGIYGVVLVVTAVVSSNGRTINLWSGLGMLVVAVCFQVWARMRPVVVPEDVDQPAANDRQAAH